MEPQVTDASSHPTVYTGLSGNEMFCLHQINLRPGNLVIGNSVYSLGFVGGIQSSVRTFVGGEIKQYTQIIAEGRRLSLERLEGEMNQHGGQGITGVTSDLVVHGSNIEFLSVGSAVHDDGGVTESYFSSAADGQELYCQVDAGYQPKRFVFGNVAYSIGAGKGILGSLRSLARGEVREYSDIFNTTRNLALDRIVEDARAAGANSVVGIETTILPFQAAGVQEMLMIGTASTNPVLDTLGIKDIVSSDLTCEEMWNITSLGYVPLRLVLGTSVYSLGFTGGIMAGLRSMVKGEIKELTTLIYDAREESLAKVQKQAEEVGADDVLGIKTYVYALGGGLIEFLAIGTAVKRIGAKVKPKTAQLLPQAIIRDKNTFYNAAEMSFGVDLNTGQK